MYHNMSFPSHLSLVEDEQRDGERGRAVMSQRGGGASGEAERMRRKLDRQMKQDDWLSSAEGRGFPSAAFGVEVQQRTSRKTRKITMLAPLRKPASSLVRSFLNQISQETQRQLRPVRFESLILTHLCHRCVRIS